ncbi:MAG TPA: metallophosphoesterase [Candidatus Paceibacterota bacterium]|nr:metallophosphoesterase [Candidatus Paceibacterota bacterium]
METFVRTPRLDRPPFSRASSWRRSKGAFSRRNPGILLCLACLFAAGRPAPAAVTGQWDFDNGDLSATVGAPLQYRGSAAAQTQFGTTTTFGIANIGGQVAQVMRFPAASPADGYVMLHGAAPNGGGAMVNQYTLILDVLFPSASGGFRAFWQTDTNNTTDADLFVNGANGIGISSAYHGNLSADGWHRVAFTLDLTRRELGKYIDGTNVLTAPVGESPLGTNLVQYLSATSGGVDQRWALGPAALLFTDEDGETGVGYVNSIQFHDRVLSAAEIAALGAPSASGIPGGTNTSPAGVVQYDFNGNLNASTPGLPLEPGAALPAAAPGVVFTNATIGGQTAQVAAFTRGTFFRMVHGLGANGGGNYLNQYTLLMDVMFPSRPTGWAALWQTNPGNANDGDWFINPGGGLGISGVYGGNVPDGAWNRLALVVDSVAGSFTSYLNGVPVQQITGVTLDGRWSLDTSALLFADENQENAAGYINSVQLRAAALAADEIAALGGPQAAGIPLPAAPSDLRVTGPNGGELLQAGTAQAVSWGANNPSGWVQIDLLLGDALYRSLGQALMRQSNFLWNIDPLLGDTNTYRIRLTSLSFPGLQDVSDAAFTVTGSGVPPNLNYGRPLQLNGGFESLLAHWEVIRGNPSTLTSAQGKGAPFAGTRFLHGGLSATGDTVVRQDIDLLAAGFNPADLDGGAAVEAEAWLRNANPLGSFDDQIYLRVACLDAARQELAAVRTMVAGNNTWVRRTATGLIPPGTRALRLEVVGRHRRDADNDSMADEVSVRIQRAWPLVNPQITKLPMLQDYRPDAMTLLWETDGNLALHGVDWGRTNVQENTLTQIETVMIDSTHFVHRATLTGLAPETPYGYRVRSGSATSPTFSFRTAPRRDTPFSVAWWGDSQVNPGVLQQLVSHMVAQGVDWMGVAGDLASNGNSLADWHNYWFQPLEFQNIAQTRPALFARGNHDGEFPFSYAYSALPGNEAWFAFDYGNSRFIFLDTEASTGAVPEQYAWLTNELARPETQNAAFRVVCFHRLPYANLWNGGGYTGETWVRNDWVPLFQQYHVDLVINGHAHNYNRGVTNGVVYLVVGGGGGALDTERVAYWPLFTVEYSLYHYGLMAVRGPMLTWDVFSNTGQKLDSFTLSSRLPRLEWKNSPVPGGNLLLALSGRPEETYILEQSSNLATWTPWATNTLPATGPPTVTNSIPVTANQGYFRARLAP